MRSELNAFKRTLTKMQQEVADKVVRYRLKNSMICTLTGNESEAYQSWVFNNADSKYRASDGSTLHSLTQAVQGTLNAPFESWESYAASGGDLLCDEYAVAETDSGVGAGMA